MHKKRLIGWRRGKSKADGYKNKRHACARRRLGAGSGSPL